MTDPSWIIRHYSQLEARLIAEGYDPRPPANPGAAQIDVDVAGGIRCPQCRGPTEYVPLALPKSYRAFAVCRACDVAHEF